MNALESRRDRRMHTSRRRDHRRSSGAWASRVRSTCYESSDFGEVTYIMLNAVEAAVRQHHARQALAYAVDPERAQRDPQRRIVTEATGPFAPGTSATSRTRASRPTTWSRRESLVAAVRGGDRPGARVHLHHRTPSQATVHGAQLLAEQAEEAGIDVEITTATRRRSSTTPSRGDFQAVGWRNHPGGDPDGSTSGGTTGSPVNFGRFNDPEIDSLLDEGRTDDRRGRREQIYEDLNRRFAEQVLQHLAVVHAVDHRHGARGARRPGRGARRRPSRSPVWRPGTR